MHEPNLASLLLGAEEGHRPRQTPIAHEIRSHLLSSEIDVWHFTWVYESAAG